MYPHSKVAQDTVLIRGNLSLTDTTVIWDWVLFDSAAE